MASPTIATPAVVPAAVRRRPVFVDDRGVRARRLRLLGRVVATLVVAYLATLVAGLAGASWVPRVALPVVGPVVPTPAPAALPHLGAGAVTLPRPVTGPTRTARPTSSPARATGSQSGTPARATGSSSSPATAPATSARSGKSTPAGQGSATTTTPGSSSGSEPATTTTTLNHGQVVSSQHSRAPTRH